MAGETVQVICTPAQSAALVSVVGVGTSKPFPVLSAYGSLALNWAWTGEPFKHSVIRCKIGHIAIFKSVLLVCAQSSLDS